MAQSKNLITVEKRVGTCELIGVATNFLEAFRLMHAFRNLSSDDPDLLILTGANKDRAGNYHRFLQSMRSESFVEISGGPYVFRFKSIISNQLIISNLQNKKANEKKSKHSRVGRSPKKRIGKKV